MIINIEKPYLSGLNDSFVGHQFALNIGKSLIGRDETQCQVLLTQNFVSRLQAMIEVLPNGQVFITNLSSKQTTFVNGQIVSSQMLNNGDRVEFGAGQLVSFQFHTSNQVSNISQTLTPQPFIPQTPIGAETFVSPPQLATTVLRIGQVSHLKIGRAADNDVVLDSPGVSRYHATLDYKNGNQPQIFDNSSTNGTFLNGEILRFPKVVSPADWISIGGFLLSVNGHEIKKHDLSASRIAAFNISKEIAGNRILQDISFVAYPREFIGLMGPSGCGKSTLMDAMNGLRPATTGGVMINDLDLYRNFDSLRRAIGYVPQKDILHDALSVEKTLYYAGKLRLPKGTSAAEISNVITEVIETVGLTDQRQTAFKQLSGGQQKRLSLGIELITKPSFLFLDEPTSPLDPETTENMMLLFRRLADEGRIVIMVTHKFEKFFSMSQIVLLTKGGRLGYFGPPQEALNYFQCQEPSEIYRRMNEKTPEQLNQTFQNSSHYQNFVAKRFAETQEIISKTGGSTELNQQLQNQGADRKFGVDQWLTLTQRYLEVKLKDKRNTLLLLFQAPLVAFILSLITSNTPNDGKTLFISAIIAIWFGANNAIREIVSESAIYTRERLVNLKIPSYVLSKYTILSGFSLLQCLLFVFILVLLGRFKGEDFAAVTLILFLTSLAGSATGLFFSAVVNSSEKAMSILPLILIPQLLLSGFLKPLDDLYVNLKQEKPATIQNYDKYQADKDKKITVTDPNNPPKIPEPIEKYEGLGGAKYIAALMVSRWTIEALAHQVSINDEKARNKLATQMSVAEYQKVLDKDSDAEIEKAYHRRMRFDLFVILLFNLAFLGLTMWALKRKDVL